MVHDRLLITVNGQLGALQDYVRKDNVLAPFHNRVNRLHSGDAID